VFSLQPEIRLQRTPHALDISTPGIFPAYEMKAEHDRLRRPETTTVYDVPGDVPGSIHAVIVVVAALNPATAIRPANYSLFLHRPILMNLANVGYMGNFDRYNARDGIRVLTGNPHLQTQWSAIVGVTSVREKRLVVRPY